MMTIGAPGHDVIARMRGWLPLMVFCVATCLATPAQAAWVGAWQVSQAQAPVHTRPELEQAATRGTLRYRIHLSLRAKRIKLLFSNEFGSAPLRIDGVSIGVAGDAATVRAGTLKRLRFDGKPGIVVPRGAPALTDPLEFDVDPHADLLVSVYLPEGARLNRNASVPVYLAPGIDVVDDESVPQAHPFDGRPILSGVEVYSAKPAKVVVALGDSITDCHISFCPEVRGWSDLLGRALEKSARRVAVLDAGIGGNRVLYSDPGTRTNESEPNGYGSGESALARFDRDVLAVPGLTHLIVFEGINDIGNNGGTTYGMEPRFGANELISAYRQLIARAHSHGVKVFGATIMPFEGASYYSPEREAVRQEVNAWIRESGAYDGVIDFDAATRDPDRPAQLQSRFDSGDHLHPNMAGHTAMAAAIRLQLFD